jgi:hypothetical protein
MCGHLYTHASGFTEVCTREPEACGIIGHGEWKPTKGLPYWYHISSYYCPICGRDDTFRERRYTPRPDRWEDRHEFKEVYDYCDAL